MGNDTDTGRPAFPEEPITRVRYAYFIAGSLLLFHSLIFMFLYLYGDKTFFIQGSKSKTKSEKMDLNSKCFLISFVSLVFIFNWMYCILEVTCGNYLTAYTVDQLNWSKTAGATLTSVFWTSFTIGSRYWNIYSEMDSNRTAVVVNVIFDNHFTHPNSFLL